jgi:hypothetical protein
MHLTDSKGKQWGAPPVRATQAVSTSRLLLICAVVIILNSDSLVAISLEDAQSRRSIDPGSVLSVVSNCILEVS